MDTCNDAHQLERMVPVTAPSLLQERLEQQRQEAASNPEYGKTYKGQLSKDEKKAKRKQILSSIGECRPTKSSLCMAVSNQSSATLSIRVCRRRSSRCFCR